MEKQVMSKKDVVQWLDFLNTSRNDSLTDFWVAKQTAWMVCVAIDELVERGDLTKESVSSSQKELRELLRLDLQLPQKQSVLSVQKDILKTAQQFDSARCKELIELLVNTAVSSQ